jgi:transcriptional regulator with XRE-family HTH domain
MNIKEERKKRNISQINLAAKVGVSLTTIQLWERGAMKPNEENYQKLLDALGILPFSDEGS